MRTSRNLGILTGAALAVAILVVAVGIPEFGTDPGMTFVADSPPPIARAADAETAEPGPVAETGSAQQVTATQAAVTTAAPVTASPPGPAAEEPEPEPRWYAFWSPFGSQVAANGFVRRLQRVTGLDYRVVKIEPGVFEVAFAYASDDDVATSLELISAATGLELPES
jgi:hypothetical protein